MSKHSTFVGFVEGEAVVSVDGVEFKIPHKHTDERRTIYEKWFDEVGLLQVLHILTDAGPLGKHCHAYTIENFFIAEGGGEVLTAQTTDCEQSNKVRQLTAGDAVKVEPFLAHTFYLQPGSIMTCVASHPYDQADVHPTPWLVKN